MDVADITITYGSGAGAIVEVYRKVSLLRATTAPTTFIEDVIGTAANPISALVTVMPMPPATTYPGFYTSGEAPVSDMSPLSSPLLITSDFTQVFNMDTSLDKVPIFNLMVLPGITSTLFSARH